MDVDVKVVKATVPKGQPVTFNKDVTLTLPEGTTIDGPKSIVIQTVPKE